MLTKLRPNSGQQNRYLERFHYIVVGAGIQPDDRGIIGYVFAGHHDDRAGHPLFSKCPAEVPPVAVRQVDIENREIDRGVFRPCASLGAVFGFNDLIVLRSRSAVPTGRRENPLRRRREVSVCHLSWPLHS